MIDDPLRVALLHRLPVTTIYLPCVHRLSVSSRVLIYSLIARPVFQALEPTLATLVLRPEQQCPFQRT